MYFSSILKYEFIYKSLKYTILLIFNEFPYFILKVQQFRKVFIEFLAYFGTHVKYSE